jgi:hypothetical protein
VVKYLTSLANLKYKITPTAVEIVPIGAAVDELSIREFRVSRLLFSETATPDAPPKPKEYLEAKGVTFTAGSEVWYDAASASLVVKNTEDQLDLIERIVEVEGEFGPVRAESPSTAGLLPVLFELPKTGRPLVFEGLAAPREISLRYDDVWSKARRMWLWFVLGGLLFYFMGRPRPWWRTVWAIFIFTALPLCGFANWTAVCNALLSGWVIGLLLNRIGAWCVFRQRKPSEVLA